MNTPVYWDSLVSRIRRLSSPLSPLPTGVVPRLEDLSDVRAVLFDVYGTLFVSASGEVGTAGLGADALAFAEAIVASAGTADLSGGRDEGLLQRIGVRGVDLLHSCVESHHRERRSEGILFPEVDIRSIWGKVIDQLKSERLSGDEVLEYSIAFPDVRIDALAVEYECRANPVWPMPGAEQLLAALRSTDVILGIVSNAQFYTPLLFEALLGGKPEQLGFCSDLCIWSYQERTAKPSDRLLRKALDRLRSSMGIRPQQVLYVGNDMRNDIVPAVDLCCRSALFAGDRRSYRPRTDEPLCRETVPDLVVTDLRELIRPLVS